ncbi:glycosyltransferase [Saccharopolyspora erythraea]|uniref:glycosyltransferase family 2 protein n=1 Tax=Saccharopolyspora erythraea TaxID=1836 RepID=UPI001BA9CFCC|nr:glycosyltransferase [Saccharopolyspora erythraea]QUH04869.1 glycosyltransferase [Saccharopolyspora erythraea]
MTTSVTSSADRSGASADRVRSTVVVVTWRGRDHVGACLDALSAQDRPHRTLVVDNASDDGTAEVLAAHPSRPEVLRMPRNLGYAGGVAAALANVRTPLVAWLNDDAAPEPGWLAALENALGQEAGPDAVAAASSALLAPDGRLQSVGVRLTTDGYGADAVAPEAAGGAAAAAGGAAQPVGGTTGTGGEVFGFCGGAVLMRMADLRAIGGVPARFFCYYEDTDTSWRLRLAGRRIVHVPGARATHLHGASAEPGSARFHRWNERNRLLTLLRCAPAPVAFREFVRFAAITCALPVRRYAPRPLRRDVPDAANFRLTLRIRVLGEVAAQLPSTLAERRAIGRRAAVGRVQVWREWAGR